MPARFQVLVDAHQRHLWRLLLANGKECGRGVQTHATVEACLASLSDIVARLARVTVMTEPRQHDQTMRWLLLLDGLEVVTSPRGYLRRTELEHSVQRFLATAVVTPLDVQGMVAHPHRADATRLIRPA